MDQITLEQIAESVAALRSEVEVKRAEIARLSDDVQRSERELTLLVELGRLRDPAGSPTLGVQNRTAEAVPSAVNGTTTLAGAVLDLLRRRGQPMHIQELVSGVRDSGVSIPGRGEPANLIAHIRTHPDIVRPVRGMYGLREWGLADRPVRPKKVIRRSRGSQKTTSAAKGPASSRRRSVAGKGA